jgi:hypothetical protein
MLAVIQLSTGDNRGEIVLALNRIILEAAISLEFLVRSTDDKYFDHFVDFSISVWVLKERFMTRYKPISLRATVRFGPSKRGS